MTDSVPSDNAVATVAPTARSVDAGRSIEWFKAGSALSLIRKQVEEQQRQG